ncbi:MAG: hypothetical protein N3J91_09990 [Verrucomicrobiae bacterium]|nr:hypothetical protein [Verrucomicrobiae bacterium]
MRPLWIARQSLGYAVAILWLAGLAGADGKLFSQNPHYRSQVDALLKGELAISRSPVCATHDLTWSEGGVHQVWGLGVPVWRLPWELAARAAGFPAFPDVWAFGLFAAVAAFGLLCALWGWQEPEQVEAPGQFWAFAVGVSGAMLILLMFPPLFGLLATRFGIYEEAVAYEYFYALVLLRVLARLAQRTSSRWWWVLCLLAGLGGFIRPPLIFYGMAAVVVGAGVWWWGRPFRAQEIAAESATASEASMADGPAATKGRPCAKRCGGWRALGLGLVLFGLGGALLFYTNLARFGSGFEFGHRLNLQNLYGSMYATRFDHPYQLEPVWSASRELLGLLFFTREFNGGDFYQQNFFPGQSPTLRWREVYLTTYNPWYWPWLAGGGVATACAGAVWWRRHRRGADVPAHARLIVALGLWGALAGVTLFGFYLRNSVISSRYLLDFMPAFGALMAAGWLGWCAWAGTGRGSKVLLPLSLLVLSGWTVWQVKGLRSAYGRPRLWTWTEVQRQMEKQQAKAAQPRPALPSYYDAATRFDDYLIPYNGAGWTTGSGAVMPLVILFVENPEYLELTVRPDRQDWEKEPPEHVRAKVGLEFLVRESVIKSGDVWVVRFRGPQQQRYQQGLQTAFVVCVPNTHLSARHTSWCLLRAEWRGQNNK